MNGEVIDWNTSRTEKGLIGIHHERRSDCLEYIMNGEVRLGYIMNGERIDWNTS